MVSITPDVELHIRSNTHWSKLPSSVKSVRLINGLSVVMYFSVLPIINLYSQSLGNAPGLYEKAINDFSVKNQLRWRSNMGKPWACMLICDCIMCVCDFPEVNQFLG